MPPYVDGPFADFLFKPILTQYERVGILKKIFTHINFYFGEIFALHEHLEPKMMTLWEYLWQ